jgi:hypothetical protein
VAASGWESMANALCNLSLGLGLSKLLVFPLPVTVIHLSFLFSPSSGVPARHQLSPDSLPLLAYLPNSSEDFVAWFEHHFELVTDQFESVALVLLVPHALVQFNLMRLLAMELLAVGARILLWLVILVLLLFSASAVCHGMLGFFSIGCTWLAFFFGQVAVKIHTVC